MIWFFSNVLGTPSFTCEDPKGYIARVRARAVLLSALQRLDYKAEYRVPDKDSN